MHDKVVNPSSLLRNAQVWQNALAKFVLCFFGIALWSKWLSLSACILLTVVWILDNGPGRLSQIIKEPLVLAILILCALLALGILWGDYPESGRLKPQQCRPAWPFCRWQFYLFAPMADDWDSLAECRKRAKQR